VASPLSRTRGEQGTGPIERGRGRSRPLLGAKPHPATKVRKRPRGTGGRPSEGRGGRIGRSVHESGGTIRGSRTATSPGRRASVRITQLTLAFTEGFTPANGELRWRCRPVTRVTRSTSTPCSPEAVRISSRLSVSPPKALPDGYGVPARFRPGTRAGVARSGGPRYVAGRDRRGRPEQRSERPSSERTWSVRSSCRRWSSKRRQGPRREEECSRHPAGV